MAAVSGFQGPLNERASFMFDHYEVERTLGRGAMGIVYLARDLRIGRKVALKTLQRLGASEDSTEFVQRFKREAELCGSLHHPNIVSLFEVGYESRRVNYLAMEYVEGESLLSLMRRKQIVPLEMSCRIILDVLAGLSYAHQHGVIHRDVKPANILLNLEGDAKITDFGIARSAQKRSSDLTESGQLLGTPHYMAPEHVAGKSVTPASDLFSIGVVFFEMVTGRKPFDGADIFDVLHRVVNEPTPDLVALNPTLPAWAVGFVRRLLEKDPGKRYPTAGVARDQLRQMMPMGSVVDNSTVSIPVRAALSAEETPTTPINAAMVRRLAMRRIMERPIRASIALGVCAALASVLVFSAVTIQKHTSDRPTAIILPAQVSETEGKRQLLREGEVLYATGNYVESVKRFEAYLARYPGSLSALQGRDRAMAAVRAAETPAQASITVKSPRRSTHRNPIDTGSPEVPPARRPSIWQRFTHLFHRG